MLTPEVERLAEALNREGSKVLIGKLDCERDDWIVCKRLGKGRERERKKENPNDVEMCVLGDRCEWIPTRVLW